MKVVILCGGKGTRLREETEFRPKPMLPIGGRPILWHIMKIYSHFGHRDFVLCLGYKGDMIKSYFRDFLWNTGDVSLSLGQDPKVKFHDQAEEADWRVTLSETGLETLTAGRIRRIRRHLDGEEHFLLTYGDGVGNIDINAAIERHLAKKCALTMTIVRPPGRFGEVVTGENDEVISFNEKPQTAGGWINGGFFVASRRLFDYLPDDDDILLEREPMQKMAAEGQLQVFEHHGFWQPMDTYQEFSLLNKLWESGAAPWQIWK